MNRAFKDITNKVLNSSGAAVIQNNLPATNSASSGAIGGAHPSIHSKGKHGSGSGNAKNRSASDQHATTVASSAANGEVGGHPQNHRRITPSVHSNNQNPSKYCNQIPHVSSSTNYISDIIIFKFLVIV